MKPLKFIGSSEDDLAAFPREVKQAAGFQLFRVQAGLMPADWKPMLSVGAGAYEIRVHVLGEWRVIYSSEIRRFNLCAARIPKENAENA